VAAPDSGMKTPPRNGELSETALVEILDFYCQSGLTSGLSITVPRADGGETTGSFFVESGALVDAQYDGREGADAVRHALRVQVGRFQVELGSRTSRRTVHEPWSALASAHQAAGTVRVAPPVLFAVEGGHNPTPPAAPLPKLTPQRQTPMATVPPALPAPQTGPLRTLPQTGPHRAAPRALGARPPTGEGLAVVASSVPAPPPPAVPLPAPGTSAPRAVQASGPATSPFSGPHTPPPHGHPSLAPFSSVRRDARRGRFLKPVLVLTLALVLGGGLAAGVALVLNRSVQAEQHATSAKPSVAVPPSAARVPGVSDTEIMLGMAAPLTGASKELGRQMRVGLDVAFARVNASGGINGRKVSLVPLDDGYEPARTREVMRQLVEERHVFSFVGNVGTPTAAVAVPYALERKMLFFGPFTGASLLRKEPPDRYVFNYRASYTEETAAIVRYLVEIRHIRPEQIAVFAQDDAYGEAGFQGVARVLRQLKRTASPILKVTYTRNTSDVSDAVNRILDHKANVAAVVMVATYRPAARFIEKVREQRPNMVFTNVSFVGSQALAEELVQLGPQYAQGVIITQVVPLPTGQSTAGLRYREALAKYAPEEKPDFISLEGYVTGNLLIEGLKVAGRNLTTDGLVDALESIHGLDLGLGVPLGFGLSEHQASHKVWGTMLDGAGTFQQLDLE
jgi:branched-chain amino acid transport system substrate-binding protein